MSGDHGLTVNKHRRRTPGYVRANPLIEFVNLADNRGPDRRRSGPYPERISSCYIKALRSSELGPASVLIHNLVRSMNCYYSNLIGGTTLIQSTSTAPWPGNTAPSPPRCG